MHLLNAREAPWSAVACYRYTQPACWRLKAAENAARARRRSRQQAALRQRLQASALHGASRTHPNLRSSTSASCILITVLCCVLTACHRINPPAPDPEPRWQIYDLAWRRGQSDRLTPRSHDWKRYSDKLAPFANVPDREAIFSSGYEDGFNQSPEDQRNEDEVAYDEGYRNGRLAAWHGKLAGSNPSPPGKENDAHDVEVRRKGFADGFNGRPHQYGRPY